MLLDRQSQVKRGTLRFSDFPSAFRGCLYIFDNVTWVRALVSFVTNRAKVAHIDHAPPFG
jgi:hypothetical protein